MASVDVQVNLQLSQRQLNAVTRQIQSSLGNLSAKNLTTIDRELNKGAKSAQTFGEAIGLSARRFVAYTSAVAVVGRLSSSLARATRDAIKFEREFVKLAQVFDTSVRSLGSLSGEISNLSKEFGINANVIARTSVILAQSGLSARDTEKALRSLAKTTLASTFEDIGSTAEGAVAILAQFGAGVGALESQLGSINAVAKKFAVESGDIIEAVRRAGGAFNAAGGNFEEFIALFTSVRSTTRESAETIATGFRTIFGRIQRPKTIEYFRQLNIELTDGQGNFIGAFEAVKRLSQGLEQAGIRAGSLKFAEVVEQLGGIRQISRVIPLLTQFGKAQQALNVAQTGSASLTADVAKAQETLSQAFARTQENFSALIREISQTETFQAFVRIALSLANAFIEVARSIKPLIPLIGALGAIKLGGIASQAIKRAGSSGSVLQFARGGVVPGSGNGDTVPAMLEPGEFVIRKSAVQAFGADNLAGINKYKNGDRVSGNIFQVTKAGQQLTNLYDVKNTVKQNGKSVKIDDAYRGTLETIGLEKDGRQLSYEQVRKRGERITKAAILQYRKDPKKPAKQRLEETNKYLSQQNLLGEQALTFKQKTGNRNIFSKGVTKNLVNLITGAYAEKTYADSFKKEGIRKLSPTEGIDFVVEKGGKKLSEVKATKNFVKDSIIIAKALKFLGLQKNKKNGIRNVVDIGDVKHVRTPQERFLKKTAGGSISGTGTDTVPALLTPGEFVINKKSAEAYGYGNLKKINKYAKGGVVQKFANGGQAGFLSGAFSPDRVLGTLAGLSLAISTLTAVFDDAEQTMKPLIAALATFSTVIVGLNAVISRIGGSKLATAIQGKIGEKFQKGLNPRGDTVDSEVAKKVTKEIADASNDNSRHLLRVISLLQSINRNLGGFSRSSGLRGRDRSGRLLSRDKRRTAGIIDQIRSGGAKKDVIGGAASAASAAAKALAGLKIASVIVTAAISIVAAQFTFLAESARQTSENAIKAGQIEIAASSAAAAASAESSKQGVLAFGGFFAAIGSLFGPIGIVVGGIGGLALALSLGEDAISVFAQGAYSVAKELIELAESIPGAKNFVDFDVIKDKIAEVSVSFSPELKKASAEIDALTKAFANASQKVTERVNKNIETFEKQLKLATTDKSRQEILDKMYEEIKEGNRLYDKRQADQEKVLKGIQERRERAKADGSIDPRQRAALDKKFAEEQKRATEELNNTIKEESTARISQTAKIFESARAYGDAARAEKELNDGKLAQRDANNIITRESLQANGELIKVFNILREAGLSEEQALTELTLAIDGTESAAKKLQKQFENQVKYLGGSFRKLFTGEIEGRLKAAQNISGALDIASGARGISSFAPSQQEGVINEFASLVQAGLIDENAIVSAFQSALPPSIFADLQNALSTQEDPAKALQDVASAFFGLDPIQKEIADNTKRTADAVEDLAKGGTEDALPNSRGGAIYAAGGTLVNFKPKGTDTVPAMLTPGEFVIKKSSVDKYGAGMMEEINAGTYSKGRTVRPEPGTTLGKKLRQIPEKLGQVPEKLYEGTTKPFLRLAETLEPILSPGTYYKSDRYRQSLDGDTNPNLPIGFSAKEAFSINASLTSKDFIEDEDEKGTRIYRNIRTGQTYYNAPFKNPYEKFVGGRKGYEHQKSIENTKRIIDEGDRIFGRGKYARKDLPTQPISSEESAKYAYPGNPGSPNSRFDPSKFFKDNRGLVESNTAFTKQLSAEYNKPLKTNEQLGIEPPKKRYKRGSIKPPAKYDPFAVVDAQEDAKVKEQNRKLLEQNSAEGPSNRREDNYKRLEFAREYRRRVSGDPIRSKPIKSLSSQNRTLRTPYRRPDEALSPLQQKQRERADARRAKFLKSQNVSLDKPYNLGRVTDPETLPGSYSVDPNQSFTLSGSMGTTPTDAPTGAPIGAPSRTALISQGSQAAPPVQKQQQQAKQAYQKSVTSQLNEASAKEDPTGALQSSIESFNGSITRLAEVLENHSIPETITIDFGTPTVNVNLNGAEVLRTMNASVAGIIKSEIKTAIDDYDLAKSNGSYVPGVPDMTTVNGLNVG